MVYRINSQQWCSFTILKNVGAVYQAVNRRARGRGASLWIKRILCTLRVLHMRFITWQNTLYRGEILHMTLKCSCTCLTPTGERGLLCCTSIFRHGVFNISPCVYQSDRSFSEDSFYLDSDVKLNLTIFFDQWLQRTWAQFKSFTRTRWSWLNKVCRFKTIHPIVFKIITCFINPQTTRN